jgi:Fic-DOC domain mobile mystery protein B
MNKVPGATPINLIDPNDLIPSISTEKARNEWETLNILIAREWALKPRVLSRTDPTDEIYVRKLHQRMFDRTWKWAGKYRSRDGINIGCPFVEIRQLIPQLLGSVRYWIEKKTYSDIDEIAVRFHHRLVWQIHAFPDGNGRHGRLLADVLVAKHGRPVFTWGPANANLAHEGAVRDAYLAALKALDANDNDVQPLIKFARG